MQDIKKGDRDRFTRALGFEPSEYQNKIFNFIVHDVGNAVVKARAGSGKTATLITAMKLIPASKKCLFLAFNRTIKEEIAAKLSDYPNCEVKTVHGLGLDIVSSHFRKHPTVDENKYRAYLNKNLSELSTAQISSAKPQALIDYCDNIIQLLLFSRLNLAQSVRGITKIAETYSIPINYDEPNVVLALMKWGKNNTDTIDYTDMVWLPNELVMNPLGNKYDWIFNDEAQDYSVAYVQLFLKCFKRGTRFVSCGDEFQSINQFAGASETAFQEMCNQRNTQVFELPISYRCDKAIINEAKTFVSDIMPRPNADLGLIKHNSSLSDIQDNDMILCRTNAPLFRLYTKLIKKNIPCYIKGKDDDKDTLLKIVRKYNVNNELAKSLETDGLFPRLYNSMIEERNRLVENGLDIPGAINSQSVQSRYDTIASLLAIASDCDTATCLIDKIESIYNGAKTGVCLSTIHKAKGLEADNVHIICRSTMPQKSAKTPSEIQQERNLIYVAITRAKHKLYYTSEQEFPPLRNISHEGDEVVEFNYIESKICKLYGKEPLQPINNTELAKFRLKNSPKVESIHKNDNIKVLQPKNPSTSNNKKELLLDLLK